jgi:hypothetical protein
MHAASFSVGCIPHASSCAGGMRSIDGGMRSIDIYRACSPYRKFAKLGQQHAARVIAAVHMCASCVAAACRSVVERDGNQICHRHLVIQLPPTIMMHLDWQCTQACVTYTLLTTMPSIIQRDLQCMRTRVVMHLSVIVLSTHTAVGLFGRTSMSSDGTSAHNARSADPALILPPPAATRRPALTLPPPAPTRWPPAPTR